MRKDRHIQTGKDAEIQACRYLENKGLRLKARNFRCPKGEIDLVMLHNDTLVFVEVRYRKNTKFGNGAESVDFRKQRKILATALYFIQRKGYTNSICRFDVMSVTTINDQYEIEWIMDAFQS